MRDISFRGKSLETGKWVEGDLFRLKLRDRVAFYIATDDIIDFYNELINENVHEVDPETVRQYTGLFDKSGEKIYEGDIVQIESDTGKIRFEDGRFGIAWDGIIYYGLRGLGEGFNSQLEVVGNIYDYK